MGSAPQVKNGSVRREAQRRADRRAVAGETVHLHDVSGDVRVQRAGSHEWIRVGGDGLTINADDTVKVADGARASLTSKTGGTRQLASGTLATALPRRKTPPRAAAGRRVEMRGLVEGAR